MLQHFSPPARRFFVRHLTQTGAALAQYAGLSRRRGCGSASAQRGPHNPLQFRSSWRQAGLRPSPERRDGTGPPSTRAFRESRSGASSATVLPTRSITIYLHTPSLRSATAALKTTSLSPCARRAADVRTDRIVLAVLKRQFAERAIRYLDQRPEPRPFGDRADLVSRIR